MCICCGEQMSVVVYIDVINVCVCMIVVVCKCLGNFDVWLMLMVVIVLFEVVLFEVDDVVFFCVNVFVLCNLSVINFFDGCVLMLLVYVVGELLVGLLFCGFVNDDVCILCVG